MHFSWVTAAIVTALAVFVGAIGWELYSGRTRHTLLPLYLIVAALVVLICVTGWDLHSEGQRRDCLPARGDLAI